MLIKAFNRGQGAGYGPLEYVCALNPFGKGERTTPPQVIKGDPKMMRMQIDAVPFAWKYTSGVVSFAKEDAPTELQLDEIMEHFEELAFAGLPLSSRSIMWVSHKHTGRHELHFVIPRQEVHSGKSFNAFPPGWENKFDHLRDMFNFKYGWARPDDPSRARPVQPGNDALIAAEAQRQGKYHIASTKETVSSALISGIEQGSIQTRNDILNVLRGMGYELPRIGKDYITILNPTDSTRTRLKGTLFQENFTAAAWIMHKEVKENLVDTPDMEKASQAEAALLRAIEKTANYNRQRYQLPEKNSPAQPLKPAPAFTVLERTMETQNGKCIHIPQTPASANQGKRTGQSLTAPGRSRNHYPSSQLCGKGYSANRISTTL